MRNYCLLLSLCSGFAIHAQNISFPDANLKAKLLQSDVSNNIAGYIKIDSNNDGEIQLSEIQNVTYLDISFSGISDLTGLNYFNLAALNCSFNEITDLSGLAQPYLDGLNCGHNQLTAFSVANLPMLVDLNCSYNFIESLNLSSLVFTDALDISNNNISSFFPPQYIVSLDIRKNNFNGFPVPDFAMEAILLFGGNPSDQLIYTDTWRNPKVLILFDENIQSIDLSNVPMSEYETDYLQPRFYFSDCYSLESIKLNNGLVSMQYSGDLYIVDCPNLNTICADADEEDFFNQQLMEMNLNAQIQVLTQCNLAVPDLDQNPIVLYPNPVNNILNIEAGNVKIASIEIYNVLGQSILSFSDKTLSIDVSRLSAGTYFIKLVSDTGNSTTKFVKN